MGARVAGSEGRIDLVVSGWQWPGTVATLRANGRVAVTFARPSDYVSYQVKGHATVGVANAEDVSLSERYMADIVDVLAGLGLNRRLAAESLAGEATAAADSVARPRSEGRPFRVKHHAFDDSVFIDNDYVIKGVPGRLLMFMLQTYQREGRRDYTNRELRLTSAIRLPDIKDNLESRLLLLRRRLDEKAAPVRLIQTGRGRIALQMAGSPLLEDIGT